MSSHTTDINNTAKAIALLTYTDHCRPGKNIHLNVHDRFLCHMGTTHPLTSKCGCLVRKAIKRSNMESAHPVNTYFYTSAYIKKFSSQLLTMRNMIYL